MERTPADDSSPAIPTRADDLPRRAFLKNLARAVVLGSTCGWVGCFPDENGPDPDHPPLAGIMLPPEEERERVRLVAEDPLDIRFRNGEKARLAVALVLGPGPEPEVDLAEVRRVVQEVCADVDRSVLATEATRAPLEVRLRNRLHELVKGSEASIEAVTAAPVGEVPEETGEPSDAAPSAPARSQAAPEPSRFPRPRPGRCLVHGDACSHR